MRVNVGLNQWMLLCSSSADLTASVFVSHHGGAAEDRIRLNQNPHNPPNRPAVCPDPSEHSGELRLSGFLTVCAL